MSNIEKHKIDFLKNQFWYLTIAASFSRANIYKKGAIESQKRIFKKQLFDFIDKLVFDNYQKNVFNSDNHIKYIEEIQSFSKDYNVLDGILKFGICQKLLNLYLKYLWCAEYIKPEPPHFPLDRMIQEHTLKKVLTNWTSLNDKDEYIKIINEIHKDKDKAKWELIEYNYIINK